MTSTTPIERSLAPTMIEVEIQQVRTDAELLVPTGIETPHDRVTGVEVDGGTITRSVNAEGLSLGAVVVRPMADVMRVRYGIAASSASRYPEEAFRQRRTRYTVAAPALAEASRAVASQAGGGRQAIQALAEETQARFVYDHPPRKFNDGHDAMPLVQGVTPGSCIDIHSYFVASLRAAGFEAGYFYGYIFPEKGDGVAHDMTCWAVTRHDGELLEWDIVHHLKSGLGTVRPGLDSRPGTRVATGHSMGHRYALALGEVEVKLLAKPGWIAEGRDAPAEGLVIRLR